MILKYQNYIVLILCAAMLSCHHTVEEPKDLNFHVTDSLLKSLIIDTVQDAKAITEITLTGSIAPDENKIVKVFPMVSGVVEDVHVQLGDVVSKGQTLAIMRSAEMAGYNKDYVSAAADLRSAKRTYESEQEMYKSGLASQKDMEDAQSDYEKAQAESKRVAAVMQINIGGGGGYEIKAPISGFVIEKNVNNSTQVRADNSENLFTIADLSSVYVLINVYESDISSVKVGDNVKITTLSYPDKVFNGKVDKIDNMLDPDTKVIHARVKIDNPGNLLKPDMFASIRIKATSGETLPVINTGTIVFDNDKNYVLVVDGKAHVSIKEITIAKKVENRAYISKGVKPGDLIVASRQVYLYESLKDQ
jgi:cobalt-zinc-cadmium efflux system membrane fusion protein